MRRRSIGKALTRGPIELVGTATATASGTSLSFGSGAVSGVQAGDFIMLAYTLEDDNTAVAPSGFTTLYNTESLPGTVGFFHKVASDSDVSVTLSSIEAEGTAVMMVLRGARIDGTSIAVNSSRNPPAITVPTDGCAVIVGHYEDDITLCTAPTGYTTDFTVVTNEDGSFQSGTAIGINLSSGSGWVDPGAFGAVANSDFIRSTSIPIGEA